MQYLLAADTSTSFLTLAVCAREEGAPLESTRLLAECNFNAGRRHAESIFSATETVLGHAGITLQEVTHLAVTTGPGSFTGLRIGVAAWKGLAFALNLPLMGVPTLDAMARMHPWQDATVAVMLDAKMGEVFFGAWRFAGAQRRRIVQDMACTPEAAAVVLPEDAVLLGDGALKYATLLRERLPKAALPPEPWSALRGAALAYEAFARYDAGAVAEAALVEPVYLRKTQAEINRDLRKAASQQA